jgi:hypothetical protein
MKKYFLLLGFFFCACGDAARFVTEFTPINYESGTSADVSSLPDVEIAAIRFVQSDIGFFVGQKIALTLEVTLTDGTVHSGIHGSYYTGYTLTNGDVVWYANDDAILSLTSTGKITALSPGTTSVKATLKNFSTQIDVTVYETPSSVSTAIENVAPDSTTTTDIIASESPDEASDYFLNANDTIAITFGTEGGAGYSYFPEILYGTPYFSMLDTVSLGHDGILDIEKGDYEIVNDEGPDFIVFENPFEGWSERAQVSVSENGIDYIAYPCDPFDPGEIYEGCAGVVPVNYSNDESLLLDPEISGGDVFDLATVGLDRARFIRIVDLHTCLDDEFCHSGEAGFDLDALAIVHGVNLD